MNTPLRTILPLLSFLFLAFHFPLVASASESGDGHTVSIDPSADIEDLYAFLDPANNTQLVLIGTIHGGIIPGKVPVSAVFDNTVNFRFEIYNDHVNLTSPVTSGTATAKQRATFLAHVKPNRTIDIAFSKREVGPFPQSNPIGTIQIPDNLRRPIQQIATVTLTGFPGVPVKKRVFTNLSVTKFNVTATAVPLFVQNFQATPTSQVQFFAGETDDPFFLDEPAFSAFLDSIRNGTPNTGVFTRGRDTYAGYNTLSIALEIPIALVQGTNGSFIGVDLLSQRHGTETNSAAGRKGIGALRTIDRAGNPWLSSFLVPYDEQDAYNAATPRDDILLKFLPDISTTFGNISGSSTSSQFALVKQLLISYGDLLQLDLSIPNTGTNAQAAFPNGRRITDDVVDTILTYLNNGTTLTDNVNSNDLTIPTTFPFLALPHQPLFNTSVDDATRN